MTPRPETIGKRLRRLRRASGLSQRDLSSPGVSYAYISRIEAGTRTPSVKALRKLAPKLGVSVEYLEAGTGASPLDQGLEDGGLIRYDMTDEEREALDAEAEKGLYEIGRSMAVAFLDLRARREEAEEEEEADDLEEALGSRVLVR